MRSTWGAMRGLGNTPQLSGPGRRNKESPSSFMDLSYYQSMCSEFRYDLEKVLGIQNRPTCGSTSTHCVLRLNPIVDT